MIMEGCNAMSQRATAGVDPSANTTAPAPLNAREMNYDQLVERIEKELSALISVVTDIECRLERFATPEFSKSIRQDIHEGAPTRDPQCVPPALFPLLEAADAVSAVNGRIGFILSELAI